MEPNKVVIIGGGVAGLCAAIHCERRGLDWLLFEASDRLGGRVGSRMIDGCRIDRGFAVLLTAYPELRGMIDLEQLDLRTFQSGARIQRGGVFIRVANPLRHPIRGVISALTGAIGVIDAFRILPIAMRAAFGRSVIDPDASHGFSARDLLRQMKVSEQLIDQFFRPFFGGIFLDGSLGADAAAFEFRLAMFARGVAALPNEGMGAIAHQLIAQIPNERIRMATAVREIKRIGEDTTSTRWCVTTNVGQTYEASAIIIALDADGARSLLPSLPSRAWCSTAAITWRVEAEKLPSALREPILLLDGDGDGPVNHLCSPTSVVAGYAPQGTSLISGNVIDQVALKLSDEELERSARVQMAKWFSVEATREWKVVCIDRIQHALPRQHPQDFEARPKMDQGDGLFLAGDHVTDGSINGAMRSGRISADAVSALHR
jgi:phytoene dehydrogenase-like protein